MRKFYFFILLLPSFLVGQNIWESTNLLNTTYDIVIDSGDNIYALTNVGIYFSTDDGDNWTNIGPNVSQSNPTTLAINNSGHLFVGSFGLGVFRSTDNGSTWTNVNNGINLFIYELAFKPANGWLFAATEDGAYRSVNNGDSWMEINNGLITDPNFPAAAGHMVINSNGNLFTSGGSKGGIYRSINNGDSWTRIVNGLIIDSTDGVAITALEIAPYGYIYTYAQIIPLQGDFYQGVFFSTTGGNTWVKRNNGLPDDKVVKSLAFNSFGHVFAGLPGGVYRSANKGFQWRNMSGGLSIGNASANSLKVNSNGRLFAGINRVWRTIYSTTSQTFLDSLKNLNSSFNHLNPSVTAIHIPAPSGSIPKQKIFPLVESVEISIDEVLHTRTGDLTFTLEHNGITVTLIAEAGGNGQDFISTLLSDDAEEPIGNGTAPFTGFYKPEQPLSAFNGMDPYGDWTLTITDGYENNDGILNGWSLQIMLDSPISNIEDELQTIPSGYSLEQNYPNPFNPSTSIQYALSSMQFVTLKVFDLLGREIAALVNEEKPAGSYRVTFDASGLTSGIYFYKLQAGSFSETKKMVLIR